MPPFTVTPLTTQVPSTSSPPLTREPGDGVPLLGQLNLSASALADNAAGPVMRRSWAQAASAATSTANVICLFMIRPPESESGSVNYWDGDRCAPTLLSKPR